MGEIHRRRLVTKKYLLFIVPILLLGLAITSIVFLSQNRSDIAGNNSSGVNSKSNSIENLVHEIESMNQNSADNVSPNTWQNHKTSILYGSKEIDKNFPGLMDVKSAIEKQNYDDAKKIMRKGLFERIASPLPTLDKKIENYRKLSKEEIRKYDPNYIFFSKDAISAIISESRADNAIEFLKLYYSL